MKKFTLTITFILMFFTTSLVFTCAEPTAEPTLEDVKNIYTDIIDKYGIMYNQYNIDTISMPINEQFKSDIEYMKTSEWAYNRQLVNFLIYKLKEIGIDGQWVVAYYSRSVFHLAVVYRLNNELYIADPFLDQIESGFRGPRYYGLTLSDYSERTEFNRFHFFEQSPLNIDKTLDHYFNGNRKYGGPRYESYKINF